ncbi:MAG: endolytic transglycosylase MltG [Deinococcota bacterium]
MTVNRSHTPDTQNRSKRTPLWLTVLLTLFFSVVIVAAVGGYYTMNQLSPVASSQNVSDSAGDDLKSNAIEFEVMPGWTASRVADALVDEGLVRNATVFTLWLRFNELDRSIGEGLYDLSAGMSLPDIARRLAEGGRPRTVRVVIPEGFRMVDIAARFAEAGFGDADSLEDVLRNPAEVRPDYIPEDVPLEGYLFPASYDIPVGSSTSEIVEIMLARFEAELTDDMREMLEQQNFSVHDWVTLASVIQSEAGSVSEMPIISGVFRNRLDEGWRMESDPTVAYGLGKDLPELDFPGGDFSVDHPWNTYLRGGLPVTPISNPGSDALEMVFLPQRANSDGLPYMFFLHAPDGGFHPNLTLDDHNRDVQTYLR